MIVNRLGEPKDLVSSALWLVVPIDLPPGRVLSFALCVGQTKKYLRCSNIRRKFRKLTSNSKA